MTSINFFAENAKMNDEWWSQRNTQANWICGGHSGQQTETYLTRVSYVKIWTGMQDSLYPSILDDILPIKNIDWSADRNWCLYLFTTTTSIIPFP